MSIMPYTLDDVLDNLALLNEQLEYHNKIEPIGLAYSKQDKFEWSTDLDRLYRKISELKNQAKQFLDQQLDDYFTNEPKVTWNKSHACALLRLRLQRD
jgi:hypothetical protein